jgi:hypothetical protein
MVGTKETARLIEYRPGVAPSTAWHSTPRRATASKPRTGNATYRRSRRLLRLVITAYLVTHPAPASASLLRDAYVQLLTPTSVTLVWDTDVNSPDDSVVHYGETPGALTETANGTTLASASDTARESHLVTIQGLAPGRTYFYEFGTSSGGVDGGGTMDYRFRTAPPVGSTTPVTAWVVGDSGNASAAQAAVRDAMLSATADSPPELFLHVGDIAYGEGTVAQFDTNFFAPFASILRSTPFWPTPGNHDAISSSAGTQSGPYYEAFVLPAMGEAGGVPSGTEAYYSFDYASAHFVVLDTSDVSLAPESPMLAWLATDLAATDQKWIIAYFHHPPYTKGSHDSDASTDSGGRMVQVRETVLPILEEGGVALVLAGHSHSYERSFLLDHAYHFGSDPDFVTPEYAPLLSAGVILDTGDGAIDGDGAYIKADSPHSGTVYVVAGHAGSAADLKGTHPVMVSASNDLGSVILHFDGERLSASNLGIDGTVMDRFTIQREPPDSSTTTMPSQTTTTTALPPTTTLPQIACGDATGDGQITATDALIALKTAVGSGQCAINVCDADGDGAVKAGDGLLLLKVAVGIPVALHCDGNGAPGGATT